jgi:hypothetical protein
MFDQMSGRDVMNANATAPALRRGTARLPNIVGLGGALAGLGGGLAMAVVGMLFALALGQDVWLEPKQIAAVIYGAAVAQAAFDTQMVLMGTVIHVLTSAVLGAIFGTVTRRRLHLPSDFGTPVLAGLVYGLLVWLVAYFVALPVIDPFLLDSYAPAFIIQHIVYGIVTGLLYAWLRPAPYNAAH